MNLPNRVMTSAELPNTHLILPAHSPVQRMLGHASAAMTLDVYTGLFAEDVDSVAERLDVAAAQSRADSLRTADVLTLAEAR